jgi:methylenetetrahydrofolate reductase (NADPH)
MPVLNSLQIRRIIYLCGASMPARLLKIVDKYEDKPQDMEKAGIEYASSQIEELIVNGMPGVHLYTMNRAWQICKIVSNTGIIQTGSSERGS